MSRQQPQRPHPGEPESRTQAQPIRPGDVLPPTGDPVARAERDALVGRGDISDSRHDQGGLVVAETDLPGKRLVTVTATAAGQVVAQFAVPSPAPEKTSSGAVTIGEALEAVGMAAGDRPVGPADAAAVEAAEARATGRSGPAPGGVASAAQRAAEANARKEGKEKVGMAEVVRGAAARLEADKVATREDAARVRAAEERNLGEDEDEEAVAGEVSAAVAAAARMNQERRRMI